MLNLRYLLLIGLVSVGAGEGLRAQASASNPLPEDTKPFRPRIEFPYLSNPTTLALALDWGWRMNIAIRYIQPGKPNQNAFIERFNRTYREEVLSSYLFEDLDQIREITHDWLIAYNERRPHNTLGGLPPTVFREQQTVKNSTYELST